MSHHSSERPLDPKFEEMMKKVQEPEFQRKLVLQDLEKALVDTQLGPTLTHPEGKIVPHDEGGLVFGITKMVDKVIINFGAPVMSIGLGRDEAIQMAKLLNKHAASIPKIIGKK